MAIYVVGGSGFLGTRLCQRFNDLGINNFLIIDKEKRAFIRHTQIKLPDKA